MSDYRDADCHTHCHPGSIAHYFGPEVVTTSIIQSITRTIIKYQSIDPSTRLYNHYNWARYIQKYCIYTVCNNLIIEIVHDLSHDQDIF